MNNALVCCRLRRSLLASAAFAAVLWGPGAWSLCATTQDGLSWLTVPFLDLFRTPHPALQIAEQSLQIDVRGQPLEVYLASPAGARPSPAILLAPGRSGLDDAVRRVARELAGLGYVALAVEYREDPIDSVSPVLRAVTGDAAHLVAGLDFLARQPASDALRIGIIGWDEATPRVLQLLESGSVRVGVIASQSFCANAELMSPAPRAPVLIITNDDAIRCSTTAERFRNANLSLQVRVEPASGISESAWPELYDFLEKHLQDGISATSSGNQPGLARVVDIMRAINSDDGIRGQLARKLAEEPKGEQWGEIRADAAMVAEGGNLLMALQPPRGSGILWRRRATDFRDAMLNLLRAVDARDFAASQRALRTLPAMCSACHADFR